MLPNSQSQHAEYDPFVETKEIKYFVGRERELKQFALRLTGLRHDTPNHFYVAGRNGAGKTFLLMRLAEIARAEGFLSAMPVLSETESASAQLRSIFRETLDKIDAVTKERGAPTNLVQDWDKGGKLRPLRSPAYRARR
jgi:hypothetical protein